MAKKRTAKKKPKLGTGERFSQLKSSLSKQGVRDPGALAASIGRAKFGKKRFQKLAATGQRRAAKKKKS